MGEKLQTNMLNMDVRFFRETALLFQHYDIPFTWHVRFGTEVPAIVRPDELISQPYKNPKKYFRKTLSVGTPDEIRNDDEVVVDQATGLRIVCSRVHFSFLQGQTVLWSDRMKAVIEEAIRLRKADVGAIKIHDDALTRKERDRSASLGSSPGVTDSEATAESFESTDAAGSSVCNQKANNGHTG